MALRTGGPASSPKELAPALLQVYTPDRESALETYPELTRAHIVVRLRYAQLLENPVPLTNTQLTSPQAESVEVGHLVAWAGVEQDEGLRFIVREKASTDHALIP